MSDLVKGFLLGYGFGLIYRWGSDKILAGIRKPAQRVATERRTALQPFRGTRVAVNRANTQPRLTQGEAIGTSASAPRQKALPPAIATQATIFRSRG